MSHPICYLFSLSIIRVDIYGDYSLTKYTVEFFINQVADCYVRLSAGSYVEGLPLRVQVFHTVFIAVWGNRQSAISKREKGKPSTILWFYL